jgi:hypothetical protein
MRRRQGSFWIAVSFFSKNQKDRQK